MFEIDPRRYEFVPIGIEGGVMAQEALSDVARWLRFEHAAAYTDALTDTVERAKIAAKLSA